LNHLKEKGADEKLVEQSGLVTRNEERNSLYDRFRGRIMFPVLDVNGDPVAFGARALGDEQPKYLNSPETPAYIKGRHLYGLFQSKEAIRQKKFAIIVEGYLDLIALYQFGVTNVVASLGTAFTPEQSKLLSRFTKKVVINYDGDDAGNKAARRAIEHLLPQDFEVKVLVLPDGLDPDDFIRQNGTEAYNEARGNAKTFLNFSLEASLKDRSLANPKQKAEAIEEAIPLLAAIKNSIQKRESFDLAMNFYRVEDAGLKRELWRTVKNGHQVEPNVVQKQVRRATQAKITVAEQNLLELILHDAELREQVLGLLEETDFETLATAPIFAALYELQKQRSEPSVEGLLNIVGGDEFFDDLVPLLMMSEPKRAEGDAIDDVFHEAENCIFTLRSMAIQNRIHELSRELIEAEQAGERAKMSELVAEHLDLSKMHHSLLNKIART
jgi:DNA primase